MSDDKKIYGDDELDNFDDIVTIEDEPEIIEGDNKDSFVNPQQIDDDDDEDEGTGVNRKIKNVAILDEMIKDGTIMEYYDKFTSKKYKQGEFVTLSVDEFMRLIHNFVNKLKFSKTIPSINEDPISKRIVMLLNTYEDCQKTRISIGNRISADFRATISKEQLNGIKMSNDDKKLLKILSSEYDRITDFIIENNLTIKNYFKLKKENSLFSDDIQLIMMEEYKYYLNQESKYSAKIMPYVREHSIYDFIKDIKGLGHMSAAYLIRYLNPYKANHPSSYHRYVGYDVVNGKGNGKWNVEKIIYLDSKKRLNIKKTLTYNMRLKKGLYIIASNFIKQKNFYYTEYYIPAKEKYHAQNKDRKKPRSNVHIHRMGVRYMMKQFLIDLWKYQRSIENLSIDFSWEEKHAANTNK